MDDTSLLLGDTSCEMDCISWVMDGRSWLSRGYPPFSSVSIPYLGLWPQNDTGP